ncbi:hypothetical protein QQS21_002694 [Conoideocrella luteorostrata]|uniref:ER-bound oxygenase mpaB/mpaB'/Rubber oxygenase catalytic domain-containing protein n=1 Tax=Conoideocrella luteorostrata TaxID=1105319 RepID=A0AAJ0G101_9HYPO|nr:hypothetical protein QQS21_002694 [Conoideocrella luteorostrata]
MASNVSDVATATYLSPAWARGTSHNISWHIILSLALMYPILCYSLRFRRMTAKQRQLGFTDRTSFSKMTSVQAQSIVQEISEWEFPLLFKMSLQFALFKTYGIPTISDLLVATRLFSNPKTASKRYEDTSILIGEFMAHSPNEQRTRQAIGRMNSLHSPYIKAGKISNEDLLYTLSVFVTEPINWINKFEWRQMTDMEICAQGTFWKSIGDAMDIKYTGHLKRDTWKDGIEFVEDIMEWAHNYELEHMVPAATNKQTADELVKLLLYFAPKAILPFAHQAIGVIMGERLRTAMMYPTPSVTAQKVTSFIFSLRRFVLRHLTLPRFSPKTEFSEKDPKTGRYYHKEYLVHPYYVKPTLGSRWGLQAWLIWALGGTLPGGSDGKKYSPEGYLFADVGPEKKKPFGMEELKEWEYKVEKTMPLGCPFAVSR